jgi:hypothetical protein
MALVVTGLSQNGDISALHKAFETAALPTDPLQVIGPDESTEGVARGIIGAELLISEGGTAVPGLNNVHRVQSFFRNESLSDRLGDLEIPDTEIDNYVEALERGRSIVAYFAHADNVDRVEDLFRSAGLLNVRRF